MSSKKALSISYMQYFERCLVIASLLCHSMGVQVLHDVILCDVHLP